MYRNVKVTELKALMREIKINLIDIRNEETYASGHLNDSINIPMERLIQEPQKYLDLNKEYYLVSQTGEDSRTTGHILSKLGYYIINLVGGYNEWIKNINKL